MNNFKKDLEKLEASLWKAEIRFDREYMENILAKDFFEFGRSGKRYKRKDILDVPYEEINAKLKNFQVHIVDENVVLVTYISEVTYADGEVEIANRGSLWLKTLSKWQLRFHQGIPVGA